MKPSQKSFRPKARRPRGFEDKPAYLVRAEQQLIQTAFHIYDNWGFEPLQTPVFEYADTLGKFLPDQERPNAAVFALQDDDESWLSLRYDLTAPLARYVAENYDSLAKPFRRYQAGSVFRNEKPKPGRFREFTQCDADSVGTTGAAADAEMIMMAAEVMRAVGLKDGQYVIKVNNRKLLDGILESAGIANTQVGKQQRGQVLRSIDKLDRLGLDAVAELLGDGRRDASGDFTEGAGLNAASIQTVLNFMQAAHTNRSESLKVMEKLIGPSTHGQQGYQELVAIDHIMEATGYGTDRVCFDSSVVRGLEYYTGLVFEAELLADIQDKKGRPLRLGSIGGGGRYDDLIARFRGQKVPATGFSFGVSRLITGLEAIQTIHNQQLPPIIICVFSQNLLPIYFQIAAELHSHNIRAEVFVGTGNITRQMKYADQRGAKFVLLMGEDEAAQQHVTLKDLQAGAALAKDIHSHDEWTSRRVAQITFPRSELVTRLKDVLHKHAISG